MAKMFYNAVEAAEKLGKTEDDLKALARQGKLREFRDAGTINYKVEDIDRLASEMGGGGESADDAVDSGMIDLEPAEGEDATVDLGDIGLEPVGDSGIELAPSGTDILALDKVDFDDTATGAKSPSNEGSSVPSVGVSVFDDDEMDVDADPLAGTAVTDLAGMAMDGSGSGSGIMDLARESDDTSLGQELLDEIYTDDQDATIDMGDDTRAGLDSAMPDKTSDTEGADVDGIAAEAEATSTSTFAMAAAETAAIGGDPTAAAATGAMAVGVLVMLVGGLATAALVRGSVPGLLDWVNTNMTIFLGGALGLTVVIAGLSWFLAKRSS